MMNFSEAAETLVEDALEDASWLRACLEAAVVIVMCARRGCEKQRKKNK